MTITFSDHHILVILAALEAYERFKINQPKTALEQIFPKECWDLGWNGMNELCRPIQEAFFPNHPTNGGPSICSEEAGDGRIAYEIQKTIQQYVALKKSGGWFGSGYDFDGNLLNPSGLPPPKIEGLEEMQYKDFYISDQDVENIENLYDANEYEKIWEIVNKTMDLPRGDSKEIIENSYGFSSVRHFYVRVHKPRKPFNKPTF